MKTRLKNLAYVATTEYVGRTIGRLTSIIEVNVAIIKMAKVALQTQRVFSIFLPEK
jgi:hypothetical protein